MGLITAYEIKKNTSMGGNVDPDRFIHLLLDVEVLILEPVIGTALYDKIILDFNEGGTNNLAGDYLTIFNDYIKPVLWHSVYAQYLRDGLVLAQNGGVYEHITDDGQSADLDSVRYLAKTAQSKADVYIERLERFLCTAGIAEYDDNQANDYDIKPRTVNTLSGWYFGEAGSGSGSSGGSGSGGNYLELE